MRDLFLKECFIENVLQCNALPDWKDVAVGDRVSFTCNDILGEKDVICVIRNKDQDSAQGVNQDQDKHKGLLGILSKEDSDIIGQIIRAGWNDVLFGTVSYKKDENVDSNKSNKIAIYVQGNPKKEKQPLIFDLRIRLV